MHLRRLAIVAAIAVLLLGTAHLMARQEEIDPLPAWNHGAAKKAIIDFIQTTTDKNSKQSC